MKKKIIIVMFLIVSLFVVKDSNANDIKLELNKYDKLLNTVYQKLFSYEKDNHEGLKSAQRLWIKYRDLDCKYKKRGNKQKDIDSYDACLIKHTKQQINNIKSELWNFENY